MSKRVVMLSTKTDLQIFMSPQRQQLLREMRLCGLPMTAKMLATRLKLSASAATHHVHKLKELGLIESDHTEQINGITAHFFRLTDVSVSIGQDFGGALSGERNAIVQSIIQNTLQNYLERVSAAQTSGLAQAHLKEHGDFLSGVVHLLPEDGKALLDLIRDFVEKHETPDTGTQAWEYAMIFYDAGSKL